MESDDQDKQADDSIEAPEKEEQPPKKPRIISYLAKTWSSALWRAYCLLPNLVRPPYRRDENYEHLRDEEQNAKSRIDPDRELRCAMAWVVELYGPDEIESLYAGFSKLGWSRIGISDLKNSAEIQVRQMRARGAGTWMNIGYVGRKGQQKPSLLASNFASLPRDIDSLNVGVFQVTPSTTALLIGFRIEDPLARHYEQELNKDRRTARRRVRSGRGVEHWDPIHQKEQSISEARCQLRIMTSQWVARYFPGYFCSNSSSTSFPTMELLVAKGLTLRPEGGSHFGHRDWQRLLTRSTSHDTWTINEYPGLQLAFERHHDEDRGLHAIITLNTEAFPEDATHHGGQATTSTYAMFCHDLLGGTLVNGATIEYLKSQKRSLHKIRERMKRARSARRHISATLNEIGNFFDQMLGSPTVTRELAKHSRESHWYRHDCANFVTSSWREGEKEIELAEAIRAKVRDLSSDLAEEETALRGQFEQLASILSVRESIRTQRWMLALAILALAVASASLLVAIYADPS